MESGVKELALWLLHHWVPGALFMPLVAYVDESGKSSNEPVFLMAGYLGEAQAWRWIELAFNKLLKRNSINRFHTTDLWDGTGDFKGWSAKRKDEFLKKMDSIATRYELMPFAVTVKRNDFEEHYKQGRRSGNLHSLYSACAQHIFSLVLYYVGTRKNCEPVHFIFDQGHHNSGGALDVFNRLKKKWQPEEQRQVLGSIKFKSSRECILLSFADVIAYHNLQQDTTFVGQKIMAPINVDAIPSGATARLDLTATLLKGLREGKTLQLID